MILIFQKMLLPQIVFGINQNFLPKLSHGNLSALMDFVQVQRLLCSLGHTFLEVKNFHSPICAMTLSLKAQNVPRKLVELLQGNLKKARFSFGHLIQAFSVNIKEVLQHYGIGKRNKPTSVFVQECIISETGEFTPFHNS